MKFLKLLLLQLFCVLQICVSQQIDTLIKDIEGLPLAYFSKINSKISSLNKMLDKRSLKVLQRLEKQELKLQKKLRNLNPDAAISSIDQIKEKYKRFNEKLKSKATNATNFAGGQYNSYLDTLGTSLTFLKQFDDLCSKVKEPLQSLEKLKGSLQQAEKLKQFIAERKQQIKQQLSKFSRLPNQLRKNFEKLSKDAYYYSAQVKEYKMLISDPAKVEKKALSLLNKLPVFQKFMKENSQLAAIFGRPSEVASGQSIAGLQTRAGVQALIQEQISRGGPNAKAQIQQNLAMAHAEVNKIKDKINKLGGAPGDIDLPDFKPNTQKTKGFLKRLELGTNMQFGKSNNYVPSGADIGLSIGYKLNDKSVIGVGGSYKMGIGDIRKIAITHQGIGVRSFIDYKLKKQFFITGGFEMNHNAQFKNIEVLSSYDAWQRSGLVGLSKKYKISKKVKGNMQILYDFLSREHVPISQPFIYRLGYTLK